MGLNLSDPDTKAKLRELRGLDVIRVDTAKLVENLDDLVLHGRWQYEPKKCVYFVQGQNGGPVKIGYSHTTLLMKRLGALQTGNPEFLVARRIIHGDETIEGLLHAHFAHLRVRESCEWFRAAPDLARIAYAIPDEEPADGTPDQDGQ